MMLEEFRGLWTYLGSRTDGFEARMDRVKSDVSALRQHFLLAQAHVPPTSSVDADEEIDSNEVETSNGAGDAIDSNDTNSDDFQMGLSM